MFRYARLKRLEATGFEPRVTIYLLPYLASVGSTDASGE